MYQWRDEATPAGFDQALADTYIGQYVLVGVTFVDRQGREIERLQMHGVIEAADTRGIRIALHGTRRGETGVMPPDLDALAPADPGKYTLHGTGEVIEDPDLLSAWTVTKPVEH